MLDVSEASRFGRPKLTAFAEGISSDYDLPNGVSEAAWAPFQRTQKYDIPQTVYEQYNNAQVTTMMGLFADINHAWVSIDNALYLWDYTAPNPEIIGFEEQTNTITAVKLVKPRKGVFVPTITHLLVVATTAEIILLGVAAVLTGPGVWTVELFQTKMSLSMRGVNVQVIEGSADSGRIFFAGEADNDVYELTYQQEEKWFASRCGKLNHTSPGYTSIVPTIWGNKSTEHVLQMVIDDSRRLVYTLSSDSAIRTFHMDSTATLQQVIEKKRQEFLRDISHMVSSPLLTAQLKIVSISPISAREGSRLHLMATTTTGCRLFLSATRGYGYLSSGGAPQSMQVQHIKFPPTFGARPAGNPAYQGGAEPATDLASTSLSFTRLGFRYPPGFFFCFVSKTQLPNADALFVSAPDTGRIATEARALTAQASKYYEQGCWINLLGRVEAIGLATPPFAASNQPLGFGNELAMQYDEKPTEVAILTNDGVHLLRRRRLVDIFAAAIRSTSGDEALEVEANKFIQQYGRPETTATALAVACGQGNDVIPGDNRIARISDPETLRLSRKVFVEYGGKAVVNENNVGGAANAADNVRPSPRHEGLSLYMGRLVRSLWKAYVIKEDIPPNGAVSIKSTIKTEKLISVQEDLIKLQQFLEDNSSFIEGLDGPESLQRANTAAEQIALQGEHQALHSLQRLIHSVIEGISFVQMLFEERVDQIWSTLDDTIKQRLRDLTFELLFSTDQGKDLAKVLVKAIVNRNIANGSNVDTVADALRRRCGSFCSADDVIIFKAQEQLKKASEAGVSKDMSRNLLNESLRLFQQVAGSLSFENLQSAVQQYSALQFYAGAINLALKVAQESDRGNTALAWSNENKPVNDARIPAYNFRKQCYDLVHQTLVAVDDAAALEPDEIDGRATPIYTIRAEAYNVVNNSDDELFQYDLYEWYLAQGWVDRLLRTDSPFVQQFLTRSATTELSKADLLWRFYVHWQRYYEAAAVLLDLAKSAFDINLAKRIEYLSRAKANASTTSTGIGRQARQVLLYEVDELLDVANIQDELLARLRVDSRVPAARKPEVIQALDGRVVPLSEVSIPPDLSMPLLIFPTAVQRIRRPSKLLRYVLDDIRIRQPPQRRRRQRHLAATYRQHAH
jgi:nuclear pore complex protein Nup155